MNLAEEDFEDLEEIQSENDKNEIKEIVLHNIKVIHTSSDEEIEKLKTEIHPNDLVSTPTSLKPCEICGIKISEKNFENHVKSCKQKFESKFKKKRQFECEFCEASFDVKAVLQRHIKTLHEKVRLFCDLCPKSFTTTQNWKKHQLAVHEGQNKKNCKKCDMSFNDDRSLKTHEEIKHLEVRFKCLKCPKSSKSTLWLAAHIRSHLAEKGKKYFDQFPQNSQGKMKILVGKVKILEGIMNIPEGEMKIQEGKMKTSEGKTKVSVGKMRLSVGKMKISGGKIKISVDKIING